MVVICFKACFLAVKFAFENSRGGCTLARRGIIWAQFSVQFLTPYAGNVYFVVKTVLPCQYTQKLLNGQKNYVKIIFRPNGWRTKKPFIRVFGGIRCFGPEGSHLQFFFRSFSNAEQFWLKQLKGPSEEQFYYKIIMPP